MNTVTRGQKMYFAAVGLLALWVGIWGYFIPTQVDKAIPWLVPPLHARFWEPCIFLALLSWLAESCLTIMARCES